MKFRRQILPVIMATVWISISEFARNEFLLKSFWTQHYQSIGMTFPSEPINGAIWGIWSLMFAIAIYVIARKFNLLQTTFIAWFMGFLMMWIAIGNLGVLPSGILIYALPLSILEAFIAALIIKKSQKKEFS